MLTFTQNLIRTAPKVREALAHEPAIRPSFARAHLDTIIVVMFCLMWNGVTTPEAIHHYLSARGCDIEFGSIEFLLNAYEGEDASAHYWSRDRFGDYHPLFEAIPGYDYIPD
jgi:hypothetical protein